MSKTLIVMRHAKSSWDTPFEDIERPLNQRGRDGAGALGDWLRRLSLSPDEILCSSAKRTRETGALLQLDAPMTSMQGLYMASCDVMMNKAQKATGDTVLLIAHNPGIGEFAERLAQAVPNHPRFFDYPSGATTVFSCAIESWSDLAFGACVANHFTTPKDLL